MTRGSDRVSLRREGLYFPADDFCVDPSRPVGRGVNTHAHADHARPGLQVVIAATGASRMIDMRRQVPVMLRWLREQGLQAEAARLGPLRPILGDHARSKRSRFITLFHAATKSRTNIGCESLHA
jgi:hypothetical protein